MRQQQQHVQPRSKLQQAKQQPVRVSLMQAAAPQPPGDAPAAAGDNYEYEDVSPGESVGEQPGGSSSSSSSDNGSGSNNGTPVVDIAIGDGGTTTSGSQSGISADADASLGFGKNGSNGLQEQEEVEAPSSSTPGKRNEFKLDPNDPYGLSIDFGRNSKINNPFMPAAPEPSPPPPPPPSPPPGPKQGALTMDISPDTFVQAVPPSFIGVSREWTPYVFFDENLDAFERVFAQLGPSPILRIGGATQDGLTKVSWRYKDVMQKLVHRTLWQVVQPVVVYVCVCVGGGGQLQAVSMQTPCAAHGAPCASDLLPLSHHHFFDPPTQKLNAV
jgi:hypothetical protein